MTSARSKLKQRRKEMRAVPGTVFILPDDLKREIPLQHRLAAVELSNQFHKIVVTDWQPNALSVRVFRDKETLNPTSYVILERDGVMVRQEHEARGYMWNVYQGERKPPPQNKPERVVRRRRTPTPSDVTEHNGTLNVQKLFVQRAEINDDLKMLELLFTRDPQPDHVTAMQTLRKKLTGVEMGIVVAAAAAEFEKTVK